MAPEVSHGATIQSVGPLPKMPLAVPIVFVLVGDQRALPIRALARPDQDEKPE
jgi:hypothetical protein